MRFDIHVSTGARQPRASGGTQTTPKRDTVAGDATAQSSTYRSNEEYMFETHAVTEQKRVQTNQKIGDLKKHSHRSPIEFDALAVWKAKGSVVVENLPRARQVNSFQEDMET